MSLEKEIVSGVSWVALGKILTQVMSFLVFVVVARFIGPDEFGLAALCYVFMALFQLIFTGISEGIVVLQIKDNKSLSSLFWAIFLISITLASGCYMGANSVATFYEEPKMAELLRVFSIFPIIVGVQAIPRMNRAIKTKI